MLLIRLIIAAIVIALCWYAIAKYRRDTPERRKKLRTHYIVVGVALFLILLTVTGRASWLGAALGGLLVLAQRLIPLAIKFLPVMSFFGNKSFIPSGIPTVKTKYLRIEVDYLSGEIKGKIIAGPHEGYFVKQLSQSQIDELRNYYQTNDRESYDLLLSYLNYSQQRQAGGSGFQHREAPTTSVSDMSVSEAQQILGVDQNASKQDIISAHKKLIQKFHPDRGGNDYLAAKINLAKDVLVGSRKT